MPRASELNPATIAAYRQAFGIDAIAAIATSGLTFVGAWAANGAAPTPTANGQYWIVSVAGTTNLGGITSWDIGDWAIYKGTGVWIRAPNPAATAVTALENNLATTGPGKGGEKVAFLQAGAGAVARTVQDKVRDRVSVSDFGAVGDGVTDDTAALVAAVNAAEGRTLHFDKPGANYLTGKLSIKSYTTLVFEGGIRLRKKLNGQMLLSLNDVEGVVILGNGVVFDGSDLPGTTSFSHTVYLFGAKKCRFENINIDGSSSGGGGMDCLYLGQGAGLCEDIVVIGGSCKNAKRNGISVVAARRTIIDGVDCSYATGAPVCGIDVEANAYGKAEDTIIRNCHLHHNQNAGIVSTFGSRTIIEDCEIDNNGAYGMAVSTGGAEFNDGVYRPNVDIFGIAAFDLATGQITLGGDINANLPIGTVVSVHTRSGAVRPAEFTLPFYVVSRHVAGNKVILGTAVGQGEITAFASAGSGTLNADPTIANIRLRAFAVGQSDGAVLVRNKIHHNGTRGIYLVGSGNTHVELNEIWNNGAAQIEVQYTSNVTLKDNHIFMVDPAPATPGGISCAYGGGYLNIIGNRLENIRRAGIAVAFWTGLRMDGNTIRDCGGVASNYAAMWLQEMRNAHVENNRIYQSELNTNTAYGIRAEVTCVDSAFLHNNCFKAGTNNAQSLMIASATNISEGNILRDGTKHLTGSATYDPASLVDAAGVTTTVTVTGAALGDFVEASFSLNLQGIQLTAYVSAANTVTVRFQNETGSTIDLGSGTIKARVRR